jgi:hypothetical protein
MVEFSTGDLVKIIANRTGSVNEVGDIGVVGKINNDHGAVVVQVFVEGRYQDSNNHLIHEVKLLEKTREFEPEEIVQW